MKVNSLKVAKIVGIIFIVPSVFSLIIGLAALLLGSVGTHSLDLLIWGVIGLSVGVGLYKAKLWSVYGYMMVVLLNIAYQLLSGNIALLYFNPIVNLIALGIILLEFYIGYLFYSNRKSFSK